MKTIKNYIKKGNLESLTQKLKADHIVYVDRSGNNLLHFCAVNGDFPTFQLLHEKGVDIHLKTKKGKSVLEEACEAGNVEMVSYCLKQGVEGTNVVRYALDGGSIEVFKMFVSSKADLPEKLDCLHLATFRGNQLFAEYLLGTVGLDVDAPSTDYKGATPLYNLAYRDHVDMVEYLIAKGANVNAPCLDGGETPIFNFVQSGNEDGLQVLLKHGAKVNVQDGLGKTPLMKAVWMTNVALTKKLLALGADPLVKDNRSRNVSTYASTKTSPALKVVEEFCAEKGLSLEDTKSKFVINQIKRGIESSKGKRVVKVGIDGGMFNFDELPDEIELFQEITDLYIGNTSRLRTLNLKMFNLKNLVSLELGYLPNLEEIPPEIGQLKTLKKLRIRFGRYEEIPPEIGLLTNLEELEINGEYANFIPPELGNLTKLKKLSIHSMGAHGVPKSFSNFTELTHLSLHGLELDLGIPEFVFQQTKLKELDISNNEIETIPARIMELTKLKKFNFQGNPLVSPPKDEIKGGFKGLKAYFEKQGN